MDKHDNRFSDMTMKEYEDFCKCSENSIQWKSRRISKEEAEDIHSEATFNVLRANRNGLPVKNHRGMIRHNAGYVIREHIRGKLREEEHLTLFVHELISQPSVHSIDDGTILHSALDEALKSLRDNEFKLIWMHHIQGYSHDKMAHELNISSVASKRRLSRIYQKLRNHVCFRDC